MNDKIEYLKALASLHGAGHIVTKEIEECIAVVRQELLFIDREKIREMQVKTGA